MRCFFAVLVTLALGTSCSTQGPEYTTTTAGSVIGGQTVAKFELTRVGCRNAIAFQDRKIELNGVEVPIQVAGSSQIVKLGKFDTSSPKIREASDTIQALDQGLFLSCVNVAKATSTQERLEATSQFFDQQNKLMKLLTGIKTATTDDDVAKAVSAAR